MAHHPEQYPTATEETKNALRAEISALERNAGQLETEASEREDFHRNVGLPVFGAAAAIAVAPKAAVTATVLVVGAGLGALFSFGRQVAEKIDGIRTEFSGADVLSGAGWGGALAPATIAYAPVRVAMAVSGVASGSSELGQGHTVTGWYDIVTSVVPEGVTRARSTKIKPGDLAARLNPKNYTVDPNTVGMSGGSITFKPPAASAAGGRYAQINEIKPLSATEIRKGLRQGGSRVGPGEQFGLLTYDPATGEVYYQIYENPKVSGQLGTEVHSELLGTVDVPKALTSQLLGNLIESPIRDLFSSKKNVALVTKSSPSANGADLVVAEP
jgi:hypothetical protein